jgi:uncharacterized protein YodC (DUF2158 family)
MNFNIGNVVTLKSGGPEMTVTGIIGQDDTLEILKVRGFQDGDVAVEYFDGTTLIRNTFRQTSLRKVAD